MKAVNILGVRGVPGRHGGFESCVTELAPYLARLGWQVTVYCQIGATDDAPPAHLTEDMWEGVRRVHVASNWTGTLATVFFDWHSMRDVLKRPGIDLVFGYNTGVFGLLQLLRRRVLIVNMDGIEWKRQKWSLFPKFWLWLNEHITVRICTHAIADHPAITSRLKSIGCGDRTSMIAYGAESISNAPSTPLMALGLRPFGYFLAITRLEPENSIVEIVRAYSVRPRGMSLYLVGKFEPNINPYHRELQILAGPEVVFPGPIYDMDVKRALLAHAQAYVHGHTVGGTNPSLVEALGAGCAIVARDNIFNRWTAGNAHFFFSDEKGCDAAISEAISDCTAVTRAREAARARHAEAFTWDKILVEYEALLESHTSARSMAAVGL